MLKHGTVDQYRLICATASPIQMPASSAACDVDGSITVWPVDGAISPVQLPIFGQAQLWWEFQSFTIRATILLDELFQTVPIVQN
jgi:hypothetical protein